MKMIAAVSEELFDRQPEDYRHSVLPPEAYYDLMVVSTGTRRMWPVRDLGPLTDAYSLTSDWDNQWLTGGLEPEVIAEAHLDPASIFAGIKRFADERVTTPDAAARHAGSAGSNPRRIAHRGHGAAVSVSSGDRSMAAPACRERVMQEYRLERTRAFHPGTARSWNFTRRCARR